jgi:hypothetical protein
LNPLYGAKTKTLRSTPCAPWNGFCSRTKPTSFKRLAIQFSETDPDSPFGFVGPDGVCRRGMLLILAEPSVVNCVRIIFFDDHAPQHNSPIFHSFRREKPTRKTPNSAEIFVDP